MWYTNIGDYMYEYVKSLLKFDVFNKGKNNFIENFNKIISNGTHQEFELLCKDEKIAKIIITNDLFWSNIKIIVEKAKVSGDIINSIKYLYNYDKNYILNKKEILFDCYKEIALQYFIFLKECGVDLKILVDYLVQNKIELQYNELAKQLLTVPTGKSIITNNLEYFISSNNELLELKTIFLNNSVNINIDEQINEKENTVIQELIFNKTNLTVKDLEKENILMGLKRIIKSVLDSEGRNYSDIKKIGEGVFSDVFKIGNKILKINKERRKFSFDASKSKLILQPIFRADIMSGINKEPLVSIDVTDLVDTQNVSYENLYQMFKKIRELGFVWVDCRLNNIGRLTKDTRVTIKDETNNDKTEILKKGTIVILDDDYIYTYDEYKNLDIRENEKLNNIYNYKLFQNFEERYQNEKTQKNK